MSDYNTLIKAKLRARFPEDYEGSKTEFCEIAGITTQSLKSWLSGRTEGVPLEKIEGLARALGTDVAEMLGLAEPTSTLIARIVTALPDLKHEELQGIADLAEGFAIAARRRKANELRDDQG